MTWDDGEPTIGPRLHAEARSAAGPARRPDEPVDAAARGHRGLAAGGVRGGRLSRPAARCTQRTRLHAALPRGRLRHEQRRERQDPRADAVSRRSTSSRPPATTAPRSARRFYVWHQILGRPRAVRRWSTPTGGRRSSDDAIDRAVERASAELRPARLPSRGRSPTTRSCCRWTAERIADGQDRRLVPGPDGVGRAGARQPQHPGRSAARGHARHHQREDQVPRAVPAVRARRSSRRRSTTTSSARCPTRS